MTNQPDQKLIAEILKRISDAVEKSDFDYLHALKLVPRKKDPNSKHAKKGNIDIDSSAKNQNPSYPEGGNMYDEKSVSEQFSKSQTLDELKDYVSRIYPRKVDVVLLAKGFRVHVPKSDDYHTIVDKIVNATLGYKLRSIAVRGETSLENTKNSEK